MTATLIAFEPARTVRNRTTIKLIKDDLTALPVDAFVFYAREDLALGSGYGTAIQQRGGAAVRRELESIGRLEMGEAVMTTAGNMAARHIIHARGPQFQEPDQEDKLRRCVRASLEAASRSGLRTIAFPPMGYGFYGVPLDLCARVMLEEIAAHADGESSIEEIILCVTDRRDFEAWRPYFERFAARG